MAPLHDTDLAENRWTQAEWNDFELWEKLEARQKKIRKQWIVLTAVLFCLLSSVPIVMDQWARWSAINSARQLGQLIDQVKVTSISEKSAYQVRVEQVAPPTVLVEKITQCGPGGSVMSSERQVLQTRWPWYSTRLLTPQDHRALNLTYSSEVFCFDRLTGHSQATSAFVFVAEKDLSATGLTDDLKDRLGVLILEGAEAQVQFTH